MSDYATELLLREILDELRNISYFLQKMDDKNEPAPQPPGY